MAIKTGKKNIIFEGREKLSKPNAVGREDLVIKGAMKCQGENGIFVMLAVADNEFISVPTVNTEEFLEYMEDAETAEDLVSGDYRIIYEEKESKKGRKYYESYLEEV